ncbi:MAG: hypothetical protein LBI06_02785 [Treponema sp.]|jgi:hypothetical protein|nr:hypothetical protein [Treponema sp.]
MNRGTSTNKTSDILSFHTEVALPLYINRRSNEVTNIFSNNLLQDYKFLNDPAFIGLLQYKERLTQIIVEKFYHETFMEFLIGYGVIRSFLSGENITKYLETIYNYEVRQKPRQSRGLPF